MLTKDSIDAALAAHSQWKKRLLEAVSTGKSEFKPETVKLDNACQFGQWLYGMSDAEQKSEDYLKVKQLHAEFHKIAGSILQLAVSGKKDEAHAKLDPGGEYGKAAGKLVLALQTWKDRM
jgi:methyl-accepting chemotaxis protein